MDWIYLSPHFDDVALSCGGLAWEQARAGQAVSIWTICGGEPPGGLVSAFAQQHHERWGTGIESVAARREEDIAACQILSAAHHHFDLPDCIYRRVDVCDKPSEAEVGSPFFPYDSLNALFGPIHPAENRLVDELAAELQGLLPVGAEVVCPLALGGHVDHRLARAVAERLGRRLWYYADYPYALAAGEQLEQMRQAGWQAITFLVSAAGLAAWQAAVAAHASQISTFWPDLEAMRTEIQAYLTGSKGVLLWHLPGNE